MSSIINKAPVLSEERKQELFDFMANAGLSFKNLNVLENAFIHSSYANESKDSSVKDNERLEFLGDSVLQVVVSEWLFENLCVNEGEYTRIRSFVVSEDSLSEVAEKLHISKYILIGKGEEITGGRYKKAILADCVEAIFAAVFLDCGYEKVKSFILGLLINSIKEVIANKHHRDFKTELQEYSQKKYKKVPEYTLIRTTGPDHNQEFYYTVSVNGKSFGPSIGRNKKDAEQNVARLAWEELGL